MNVIYPPARLPHGKTIFLAGTIDDGNSKNWQLELVDRIDQYVDSKFKSPNKDLVSFLNPRRLDWTKADVITRDALERQIEWELIGLEYSDHIFMWFEPNSKSPITLLELGLFMNRSGSSNMTIGCPPEFYRSTNVYSTVDFFSKRNVNVANRVQLVKDWETFVSSCTNVCGRMLLM